MTDEKKKFLQETRFEEDYNADKATEDQKRREKLRERYPQWQHDT